MKYPAGVPPCMETSNSIPMSRTIEPLTSARGGRLAGFGMAVLIGAAETIGVLHPEVAQPGKGSKAFPVSGNGTR